MSRYVVVGAGPVGRETARLLAERGEEVLLASRSGRGEEVPGARRVAVDAADAEALTGLVQGASAFFNCVNPGDYTRWERAWPPVAAALLTAAERTGALLAVTGNLYPYGPVDGPMTEDLPDRPNGHKSALRARMSADAFALHEAGRAHVVEVRGSDYTGRGVRGNGHLTLAGSMAIGGRTAWMIGDPGVLHSWTNVTDMARALVAVADAPRTWGRVWHAPTNPARSGRDAVADLCRAAGVPVRGVRGFPPGTLGLGGLAVPLLRELKETAYQFRRDYVLDSSAITRELGLAPTPWEESCRVTAEDLLAQRAERAAA
ncbi:NAD-dependent epimerase/dehydratase family protein [Nocardioides sp. GY 10127]|uniref:NAD-dependent epimerase/dehydratase family protein n=1 Tax=Nocardioides sp. GY 10127 TaxID=2569762 RepID=UPI0010A8EBFB|nr:NAD-dependent epimerase/dehydratase family protein [Nocardioides sp. GY 10127]TIC80137.1 NAD-dependent epimerase/dehydratase family protein [Nocardioides sp. GY 10127]